MHVFKERRLNISLLGDVNHFAIISNLVTFNIKFLQRTNRLFFIPKGRSNHKILLEPLSRGALTPLYMGL